MVCVLGPDILLLGPDILLQRICDRKHNTHCADKTDVDLYSCKWACPSMSKGNADCVNVLGIRYADRLYIPVSNVCTDAAARMKPCGLYADWCLHLLYQYKRQRQLPCLPG